MKICQRAYDLAVLQHGRLTLTRLLPCSNSNAFQQSVNPVHMWTACLCNACVPLRDCKRLNTGCCCWKVSALHSCTSKAERQRCTGRAAPAEPILKSRPAQVQLQQHKAAVSWSITALSSKACLLPEHCCSALDIVCFCEKQTCTGATPAAQGCCQLVHNSPQQQSMPSA